ncbi:MAG TPA: SMP-30/gluconolactonase/LRE family protein [Candidatus Krumholzibacteria bacterium]|nr:SMP-30/gluconolactonase/LRE family protein [Candidatus Krumholzibacteria bacterium]
MMDIVLAIAGAVLAGALLYLLFWPMWVRPVAWSPSRNPGWTGVFAPLSWPTFQWIETGIGPEDVVRDRDGFLLTGLADGRIVRVDPATGRGQDIARTGGRPLGVILDAAGELFTADPDRGLLHVAMDGTVTLLTDSVDGTPIGFADGIDVDRDGVLWFSDMSTRYPHDLHMDYWEGRASGRLLTYDRRSGVTSVRASDLHYPNGVALGPGGQYIVVCEMIRARLVRIWLDGPRAGERETFADGFPAYLDNIFFDAGMNLFWVALVGERQPQFDRWARFPLIRRSWARIPGARIPHPMPWYRSRTGYSGAVVAVDTDGKVCACLRDAANAFGAITSVHRFGDSLYLGSIAMPAVARVPLAGVDTGRPLPGPE